MLGEALDSKDDGMEFDRTWTCGRRQGNRLSGGVGKDLDTWDLKEESRMERRTKMPRSGGPTPPLQEVVEKSSSNVLQAPEQAPDVRWSGEQPSACVSSPKEPAELDTIDEIMRQAG